MFAQEVLDRLREGPGVCVLYTNNDQSLYVASLILRTSTKMVDDLVFAHNQLDFIMLINNMGNKI